LQVFDVCTLYCMLLEFLRFAIAFGHAKGDGAACPIETQLTVPRSRSVS